MKQRLIVLFAVGLFALAAEGQTRRRAASPVVVNPNPGCVALKYADGAFAYDIEIDNDYIYYGDDLGGVFRVSKNGGPPQMISNLIEGEILGLMTSDETTLYILAVTDAGDNGDLFAIPKTGGTPQLLAGAIVSPFDLTSDATSVYWVSIGTVLGESFRADGRVERVNKDGTGRATLASNLNTPAGVASDGTTVFFGEAGFSPQTNSSGLRSVPKNGGTIRALRNNDSVTNVMVNGNDVYFESLDLFTGGEIMRMPKTGGTATSLLKNLQFVNKMTVAGDRLYFLNSGGDQDTIEWIPLAGSARTVVQSGPFITAEFALDDCGVYFIDELGQVRRTPR